MRNQYHIELLDLGFERTSTGGNCEAFIRTFDDGTEVLATNGEASAPDDECVLYLRQAGTDEYTEEPVADHSVLFHLLILLSD
jgi:hypothetical protein